MIYDGITYLPDYKGKYYCKFECHDKNYPPPKWLTEKGFTKHLEKCKGKPDKELVYVPETPKIAKIFCNCQDCGDPILEMTSCWKMHNKTVCIDCYRPYFEKGIGFHGPAGWEPPGITLEG